MTGRTAALTAAAAVETTTERGRRRRSQPRRAVRGGRQASRSPQLDEHQVVAYDLAHAAAAVEGCRGHARLRRARRVRVDARVHATSPTRSRDVGTRIVGREDAWGVEPGDLAPAQPFVAEHRDPAFLESRRRLAARSTAPAPTHLDDDFDLVARDVPPLRRRQDPPGRRARPPHATPTSPKRSSRAWPRSAASASRCPRSTAASRPAASPTTSRMCVATEELSLGLARHRRLARSPGPRSSPAPSSRAGPRSRSTRGCRRSRPASAWSASW